MLFRLLVVTLFLLLATTTVGAEAPAVNPVEGSKTEEEIPDIIMAVPGLSDIWRALRRGGSGDSAVPDPKAGILIQSGGQDWRVFRNEAVIRYTGWALAGLGGLLVIVYAAGGCLRIQSGFAGRTIPRFTMPQRAAHWLLALGFLVLALTGLTIIYGRDVIRPLIGFTAYAEIAGASKRVHDFTGFAFAIGLILFVWFWIRDVATMHGAGKFNAGQKTFFWFVTFAGFCMVFSGLCLLLPFTFTPFGTLFAGLNLIGFALPTDLSAVQEMQLVHTLHSLLGLVMMLAIVVHIYLGTIGIEGTFDAIWSGRVDANWARERHPIWFDRQDHDPRSNDGDLPEDYWPDGKREQQ